MPKQYSVRSNTKGMDVLERERKKRVSKSTKSYTPKKKETFVFEISLNTILLVLAIWAGIYFGTKLLQVAVIVFFAFIISSAALPAMRWFINRGISKGVSIFLVYFIGFILITGTFLIVLIPSINEVGGLISRLPELTENFFARIDGYEVFGTSINVAYFKDYFLKNFESLESVFTSLTSGGGIQSAIEAGSQFVGGIVSAITAIIVSVYILIDHDSFFDILLLRIIEEKKRMRVRKLVLDVEEKLGKWVLGQGVLTVIMGTLVWVALTILGVPFALPLAVLAGLMESVPSFGPILAFIPTIVIAYISGGPAVGTITTIVFILIQQLDNTFVVPKVMSGVVGIKPIAVLLGIISGFAVAGPLGAVLAVPVIVLLQIAYEFYIDLQKLKAEGIV